MHHPVSVPSVLGKIEVEDSNVDDQSCLSVVEDHEMVHESNSNYFICKIKVLCI